MSKTKRSLYTKIYEIDINEELKVGLKRPGPSFLMKYFEEIQNIPILLQSKEKMGENYNKVFNTVEKIMSYCLVEPDTGFKIISKTPNENQCEFEDFTPDGNWELLETQGIKNLFNNDVGFALFFYLMEETGNFSSSTRMNETREDIGKFPKKRSGDKNTDNGKKLSDSTK